MTLDAGTFLAILLPCFAAMLVFRCVPLLALKGRALSPRARQALGTIPVAAFAALVANDLVSPDAIAADPLSLVRLVASAAVVCVVARKTSSLIWCALAGMASLALLELLV